MSNPIIKTFPLGFPWETQDPFLFCVHHNDHYPKGDGKLGPDASLAGRPIGQDFSGKDGWSMYHGSQVPGFPSHPHRGFETVTIVQKGFIDHSDSLGAAARFGNGDVQWMTAGKGVQHSEMFPLLSDEQDNPLELFQIWLNLPRKSKYVDAYFQMSWKEDIPFVTEKGANIKIVAGIYGNYKAVAPPPDSWASDQGNDVAIWVITLKAEARCTLPPASEGTNRNLYFFEGEDLSVAGQQLSSFKGMTLHPTEEVEIVNGAAESKLLLLQGKPMKEPVVQQGPFVMNTPAEIKQTMLDYQKDQFGGWPWPNHEHVHPKDSGRFARYVDGSEEFK